MMRLGRRASLLVAFYLLTSAATAYAECTWVLWARMWTGQVHWSVQSAHVKRNECMSEAAKTNSAALMEYEKAQSVGQQIADTRYVCFPDTVDPRGPKER